MQALGLVPLPELDQRGLSLRRQQAAAQVQLLLPLRTAYSALFTRSLLCCNVSCYTVPAAGSTCRTPFSSSARWRESSRQ